MHIRKGTRHRAHKKKLKTVKIMETNNKIIAEFMGWEEVTKFSAIAPKSLDDCWNYENMVFHSNWNWLMEVVEKIESSVIKSTLNGVIVTMGKNLNHKQYCYIEWGNTNNVRIGHRNLNGFYSKTIEANTLIEAVYIACVEFIEWYNENSAKEK